MPRGTIAAFDEKHGTGTVHLETGDDVHFDLTVATGSPRVGQSAEVVTGIGLGGQLVARLVLVAQEDGAPRALEEGLRQLQVAGLLDGLSVAAARGVLGGDELTREGAGVLLLQYYGVGEPTERTLRDTLLCLDEHFGDTPRLPVSDLVGFAPEARQPALAQAVASLKTPTLGALLAAFNGVLQQGAAGLHYYLLDVDSDRFAVVTLRDDAFARAAHATVLRVVS